MQIGKYQMQVYFAPFWWTFTNDPITILLTAFSILARCRGLP